VNFLEYRIASPSRPSQLYVRRFSIFSNRSLN
jgi:hypothetical protein